MNLKSFKGRKGVEGIMHNSVEVAYQKGKFNVIGSVDLATRDRHFDIKTSKEANKIALELVSKYKKEGHVIDTINLW